MIKIKILISDVRMERLQKIINLLSDGYCSNEELQKKLGFSRTVIKNDLEVMRKAIKLSTRQEGHTVFYKIECDIDYSIFDVADIKSCHAVSNSKTKNELNLLFQDKQVSRNKFVDLASHSDILGNLNRELIYANMNELGIRVV